MGISLSEGEGGGWGGLPLDGWMEKGMMGRNIGEYAAAAAAAAVLIFQTKIQGNFVKAFCSSIKIKSTVQAC